MLIRTSTRYPAQFTMAMDGTGREHLLLVAKGTFDFPEPGGVAKRAKEQRPLIFADEYTGAPGFSAPLWETDFAFRKARCDVVAQGAAYAPDGQPAERVRVGLRVGDWVKQFDVVGPRQWRTLGPSITATRPYPFTRLAFGYDTAFGGPDRSMEGKGTPPVFAENPVGLGYATARSGSRLDGLDLPLTEDPADPVISPFGAHRPMALGPVARSWPQRARTTSWMRRSSSGAMEVPVGLDGEASSTPRVFAPQAASTLAALSWKRSCAVVGISTALPSAALTKWRLQG